MRYKRTSIRDAGLEAFINENYPNLGYKLLVTLIESEVNPTNIGKVFNKRSIGAVKEWIKVYREEALNKVVSSK